MYCDHDLQQAFLKWQYRGARPDAELMIRTQGCVLRMCTRMRAFSIVFLSVLSVGAALAMSDGMVGFQSGSIKWFVARCSFPVVILIVIYYVPYTFLYRIELDVNGIKLFRFLMKPVELTWREVKGFRFAHGDELLKIDSTDGRTMKFYPGLNGLSAVRRCLALLVPQEQLAESWKNVDPIMMELFPAWRCSDEEMKRLPF